MKEKKTKKGGKNGNAIRNQDPFLERERAHYGNPLPSRDFVM